MKESLKSDIVYCKSLIRNLETELNKARRTDESKVVNIKVSIERYNRVLEKLKTRYTQLGDYK
jgi:uncharacterized protein YaaN involved in tellurite resistance